MAFARQGSKLIIHYNASKDAAEAVAAQVRALGAKATLVGGDVTQSATIKRIVSQAVAAYGRIDVLINNAGGMIARKRIEEYTDAYLGQVLALNVTQVALFMHEVIPLMRLQKSGNVINVSSIAARHGGGGGAIIYAGAKGFISTATKGWAKEVVGDGIRVNAVSPGVITTPFHERYSTAAQLAADASNNPDGPAGIGGRMCRDLCLSGVGRDERIRDRPGDRSQWRPVHGVAGRPGGQMTDTLREKVSRIAPRIAAQRPARDPQGMVCWDNGTPSARPAAR